MSALPKLEVRVFGWEHEMLGLIYGFLLKDPASGECLCIDAGNADAVLAALERESATLTQLYITHHHADHRAGMEAVRAQTGCQVIGTAAEFAGPYSPDSGNYDIEVRQGDTLNFAGREVQVLQTPGHTLDLISLYLPSEGILFPGDTLFAMGCGRLFEGDANMLYASLGKLAALPPDTAIYFPHEMTLTNAAFALSVDPHNERLRERQAEVEQLRAQDLPTTPTLLQTEFDTNPFLRTSDRALRRHLGMETADEVAVLAELRRRRDNW